MLARRASGIGLATAKRFVEEGAYVFITGRRQTELEAVKEIGKCVTAVRDVSELEDLDHLYRTVAAQERKIDILSANTGIVELKQTPDVTPEHFDKTFNTNARGLYFTVRKALSVMNDGAAIILDGSCVWLKGFLSYSTYGATKAALRSFARTWTTELKDRKIRANIINPGASSPAHSHPCPVLAYVAEGTIRSQVNDEPERVYKVGETFYEAPNGVHRVSTNASQTESAKLIAFFVCKLIDWTETQSTKITFGTEAYNLFNHPNLAVPSNTQSPPTLGRNGDAVFADPAGSFASNVGRIFTAIGIGRQIQLDVRFTF
jgi:NAD(P)-dependent dehydrogenase (short-subunit alcohol dehydrogenase family)